MNEITQLNVCAESTKYMHSMKPKSVRLLFADPPYNMQLEGELWRPNATKVEAVTDEWDQFDSFAEYDRFTLEWLLAAQRVLMDNGSLVVIGSYHNIFRVGKILQDLGFWIQNDIQWIKDNPMPNMKGTRLCNATETLIWALPSKNAVKPVFHYHTMKSGNEDRQLRNDWYFPICSGHERLLNEDGKKAHNTQKPEALLYRIITMLSDHGDLVLDPFGGSGTTASVCKRLGRSFITVDELPSNHKLTAERLEVQSQIEVEVPPQPIIDTPPPKIPFVRLVETGRLQAGSTLWFSKDGKAVDKGITTHTATVMLDGTVQSGPWRGSIHKVGAKILGAPSCNGWKHWHFGGVNSRMEAVFYPIDNMRRAAAE